MLQNPLQQSNTISNQRLSPLVAGVAGIIAGVAGVTALALSDKEIRKKVGKRATEMRITLQNWSAAKLQEYNADTQKIKDTIIEETMSLEENTKN